MIVAYNDSEAIMAARKMVTMVGRKPEDYQIPYMLTKADIEKLVPDIERYLISNFAGGEVEASPNQISEYIAKVFETVGTAKQKEMATAVIEKYKRHAKFIPIDPYEAS